MGKSGQGQRKPATRVLRTGGPALLQGWERAPPCTFVPLIGPTGTCQLGSVALPAPQPRKPRFLRSPTWATCPSRQPMSRTLKEAEAGFLCPGPPRPPLPVPEQAAVIGCTMDTAPAPPQRTGHKLCVGLTGALRVCRGPWGWLGALQLSPSPFHSCAPPCSPQPLAVKTGYFCRCVPNPLFSI